MKLNLKLAISQIACLLRVHADWDTIWTLDEGDIGPSVSRQTEFKGQWKETLSLDNVNGFVHEKVSLRVRLGIGRLGLGGGSFVQAYASFDDLQGTVDSFTCSTEFNFGNEEAAIKVVESFSGEFPLLYDSSE